MDLTEYKPLIIILDLRTRTSKYRLVRLTVDGTRIPWHDSERLIEIVGVTKTVIREIMRVCDRLAASGLSIRVQRPLRVSFLA